MPIWWTALALPAQISIVVAIAIVILLVVIFGRKLSFSLGGAYGPRLVIGGKKRSCADCALLLFSKRERLEYRKRDIENKILKNQMNFAEIKLLEVQSGLLHSYREDLKNNRGSSFDHIEEHRQYKLYQGLLSSALMSVKDEIRRSFKENGFEKMGGSEFSTYVKNKATNLTSIGKDFMINMYPYDGMIISLDSRLDKLDAMYPKLEDSCFETYVKAKEVINEANEKIEALSVEFATEIDEFLENK